MGCSRPRTGTHDINVACLQLKKAHHELCSQSDMSEPLTILPRMKHPLEGHTSSHSRLPSYLPNDAEFTGLPKPII